MMPREYDFGEGEKVMLTGRTGEHQDMFAAMQTLGPMGGRIAKYINNLKAMIQQKDAVIAALKGQQAEAMDEETQAEVHQREFPKAAPSVEPRVKVARAWIFSDSHTPTPWHMTSRGMIKSGNDWICAVTARNRIYNAPLIQAAPDMLDVLERMLSSPGPGEAQRIIAEANALVERAKAPAWQRPIPH